MVSSLRDRGSVAFFFSPKSSSPSASYEVVGELITPVAVETAVGIENAFICWLAPTSSRFGYAPALLLLKCTNSAAHTGFRISNMPGRFLGVSWVGGRGSRGRAGGRVRLVSSGMVRGGASRSAIELDL